MTDADPVIDAEPRVRVTRGHIAAAIAAATIAGLSGMVIGWFTVPPEALSVPTSTDEYGITSAAYRPVPTWAPVAIPGLALIGLYVSMQFALPRDDGEGDDEEDGGDEDDAE